MQTILGVLFRIEGVYGTRDDKPWVSGLLDDSPSLHTCLLLVKQQQAFLIILHTVLTPLDCAALFLRILIN